jgi:uncharacterized protein YjiS (DUF1127 family)
MKVTSFTSITLLLATNMASAFAAEPLTREQVHAEYLAARDAGEIPFGDLDITQSQVNPRRFPKADVQPGLTREQVRAELAAAVAAGDEPLGDTGETRRELLAAHKPPMSESGLTRAEVSAEARRAIRLGDFQVGDSGRTAAEINPQAYAAARAKDQGDPTVFARSGRWSDQRPLQ